MKNKKFDIIAKKLGFENHEAMCRAMDTYGLTIDVAETQQESIDYCQVVEMSTEEKVAMLMKLTKRELIEMLLRNQEIIEKYIYGTKYI
jgi:hypothetical protein